MKHFILFEQRKTVTRVLKLWMHSFYTLLRDDNDNGDVPILIHNDGIKILLPGHEELIVLIIQLKNNKLAGPARLPAELYKTVGNELGKLPFDAEKYSFSYSSVQFQNLNSKR